MGEAEVVEEEVAEEVVDAVAPAAGALVAAVAVEVAAEVARPEQGPFVFFLTPLPKEYYELTPTPNYSSSSNAGGSTRDGSGRQPSYGRGGAYYAGGASTPYAAGRRSPLGIAPFFLPLGALAFFPGLWLYGAYGYPFHNQYHYVNQTSHKNESMPVVCVCQQYSECGCDGNNNQTYFESLFNGTEPKNTSMVRVVDVNGTEKIYINGTLPNGTTAADPSASSATVGATLLQASGYWVMAAVVASAVWVL